MRYSWLVAFVLALCAVEAKANETAPLVGIFNTDNLPPLTMQGPLTINAGILGVSSLSVNPTWLGTLAASPTLASPNSIVFNDGTNGANSQTISGLQITDNYLGNGTQLSGARAALSGILNILGPQAQTGIVFKQYVAGLFSGNGTAGDGSVITTTASTCDASTCTAGTIIPVAAVTQTNGIHTWKLSVGDKISITLDAGQPGGFGYNNVFSTIITAINGLNITINPGIPGIASSGAAVYDLTPAASIWGVAATCRNNANGTIVANDPPSNLLACVGGEFDAGSTTQKMWMRFGVLASGIGDQQGVGDDAGLIVNAQTQPFMTGLAFSTGGGAAPVSTNGVLIRSEGAFSTGSLIDFGSITSCSSRDINMPNFTVTCAGAINATASVNTLIYKVGGVSGATCSSGISATTGRSVNGIITAC